jgi:lipoprotein NlpD
MNARNGWRFARLSLTFLALAGGGCVVSPTHDAPIVERSKSPAPAPVVKPAPPGPVPAAPTVAREVHDSQYTVQAGDTLYSVALAFGQDYRDLARWNGIDDPSRLKVGQALRVAPPDRDAETAAATAEAVPVPLSTGGAVQTRPLDAPAGASEAPSGAGAPTQAKAEAAPAAATAPARAATADTASAWTWPGAGRLIERFDEPRNKGIDLAGAIGDPVLAANDGQVVYSGSGLRGYGNLVIIKHTDDFVSAYAHNSEILVAQGQAVRRGQKIATLGASDAPDARLHFEIRRRGKPVDPLDFLPAR